MAVVSMHANALWFLLTALITWNIGTIMPFINTIALIVFFTAVQSAIIGAILRVILGRPSVADGDALSADLHPVSMSFWFVVGCIHASGPEYALRHMLLLGIQRLLRLPRVRLTLWMSLGVVDKLRLTVMALFIAGAATLATGYWATDPFGDHPTQSLLLAEGACALVSALVELLFVAWTFVSSDILGAGAPDNNDTAPLLLALLESVAHLLLSIFATSADRRWGAAIATSSGGAVSTGPPLHIQVLMLKRIYLVAAAYTRFGRAMSILQNVPDLAEEDLKHSPDCTICLEPLHSGKRLPCGHGFHAKCLRRWLMNASACPLCRRRFLNLGGRGLQPVMEETDEERRQRRQQHRHHHHHHHPHPAQDGEDDELRRWGGGQGVGVDGGAPQQQQHPTTGDGYHHPHRVHPPPPPSSSSDDDDDDDHIEATIYVPPPSWPFRRDEEEENTDDNDGAQRPDEHHHHHRRDDAWPPRTARRELLDELFGSPIRPSMGGFPATGDLQPQRGASRTPTGSATVRSRAVSPAERRWPAAPTSSSTGPTSSFGAAADMPPKRDLETLRAMRDELLDQLEARRLQRVRARGEQENEGRGQLLSASTAAIPPTSSTTAAEAQRHLDVAAPSDSDIRPAEQVPSRKASRAEGRR